MDDAQERVAQDLISRLLSSLRGDRHPTDNAPLNAIIDGLELLKMCELRQIDGFLKRIDVDGSDTDLLYLILEAFKDVGGLTEYDAFYDRAHGSRPIIDGTERMNIILIDQVISE